MSPSRLVLYVMLLSYAFYLVDAHGWMSNPIPRGQYRPAPTRRPDQEAEPTRNKDVLDSDFICRSDPPIPVASRNTYTAGQKIDVTITFVESARHVGDCFLYLTYDGDKAYDQMKWFKIFEQTQCSNKSATGDVKRVTLPSYLPSGTNVILRWEWYAVQNMAQGKGMIEYFAQCADINILGSSTPQDPEPKFNIPGHLPVLNATNYWDPYNDPYQGVPHFYTGPPMAVPSGVRPVATNAPTRTPPTGATQRPSVTAAPTERPATAAPTQRPATAAPTQRPVNTAAPTQRPVTVAPTQRPDSPAPSTSATGSTPKPKGPCRPKRSSVAIN